jgi:proton-translocating NADH-quinone oxidoreductase chain N
MSFLTLFQTHFSSTFPELFLVFLVTTLLVYGVVFSTSLHWNLPLMTRPLAWVLLWGLGITLLLVLSVPAKEASLFQGVLYHSSLTRWVKVFLLLGALACLGQSLGTFKRERINAFEYLILFLLALLGMFLMVSANDLISIYLGVEMQSLSLYVLAAFQKRSAFSTEAGLKYFLLGAFSSGLLLFGSSLIYGFTGTTNLEVLAVLATGAGGSSPFLGQGLVVGALFLGSGLLFKVAAAPLHMWSPDVYEGAPTTVSAFFAILPKLAVFCLLLRVFAFSLYDFLGAWQGFFLLASFLSMVVGSFGALAQKKIKRLLAYSSIGHVGYMLIGLAGGSVEGIHALLLYLVIYMVMSVNVWTVVLSLGFQEKGGGGHYLIDLAGLGRTQPLLALTLALTLFSMSGMPPLAGFCAKLYIFFSAMEASLYLLAVVGVLTSCVGSFYYLRLIKVLFFGTGARWNRWWAIDREKSLLLGGTTLFILFFFLFPRPLLLLTFQMALSLAA